MLLQPVLSATSDSVPLATTTTSSSPPPSCPPAEMTSDVKLAIGMASATLAVVMILGFGVVSTAVIFSRKKRGIKIINVQPLINVQLSMQNKKFLLMLKNLPMLYRRSLVLVAHRTHRQ